MDIEKPRKKILLAVRPADFASISEFLGTEFDFVACTTLEEAIAHLTENIGLILCGVHFDCGKMFELLEASQANPATRWVPHYLLVSEDTNYSHAILEGIRSAATVKGVSGFINFAQMVHAQGREETRAWNKQSISEILIRHTLASKDSHLFLANSMISRQHP
jgi:hypothetical protein